MIKPNIVHNTIPQISPSHHKALQDKLILLHPIEVQGSISYHKCQRLYLPKPQNGGGGQKMDLLICSKIFSFFFTDFTLTVRAGSGFALLFWVKHPIPLILHSTNPFNSIFIPLMMNGKWWVFRMFSIPSRIVLSFWSKIICSSTNSVNGISINSIYFSSFIFLTKSFKIRFVFGYFLLQFGGLFRDSLTPQE